MLVQAFIYTWKPYGSFNILAVTIQKGLLRNKDLSFLTCKQIWISDSKPNLKNYDFDMQISMDRPKGVLDFDYSPNRGV